MSVREQNLPLVGKISRHNYLTPDLAIIRVQPTNGHLCLTLKLGNLLYSVSDPMVI